MEKYMNIELVRECLDHWDKIVLKLEERLNQLYKDCSIRDTKVIKLNYHVTRTS